MRREFNPMLEHQRVQMIAQPEVRRSEEEKFARERVRQREAIATIGGLMIESVIENPLVPEKELLQLLEAYQDDAELADYQRAIFLKIVKEFSRRRSTIDSLASRSPVEQIDRVFHLNVNERDVEAKRRPFTMHYRLAPEVFAKIVRVPVIEGAMVGGMYFSSKKRDWNQRYDTNGVVSIGRRLFSNAQNDAMMRGTEVHEETHALYDLLVEGLGKSDLRTTLEQRHRDPFDGYYVAQRIVKARDKEAKQQVVNDYWDGVVRNHSNVVKNEAFAYTREGVDPKVTRITLAGGGKNNACYSVFQRDRADMLGRAKKGLTPEDFALCEKSTNAFFEKDYRRYIDRGFQALHQLIGDGYTIEQAMVYLIDVPFGRWEHEVQLRRKYGS